MARRKAGLFFGILVGWVGWIFYRSRKQKPVLDLQEEMAALPGAQPEEPV